MIVELQANLMSPLEWQCIKGVLEIDKAELTGLAWLCQWLPQPPKTDWHKNGATTRPQDVEHSQQLLVLHTTTKALLRVSPLKSFNMTRIISFPNIMKTRSIIEPFVEEDDSV